MADLYYAEKDYDAALNFYRKASVRISDAAVALAAKFYSARCLEAIKLPSEARLTYEDIVGTQGSNDHLANLSGPRPTVQHDFHGGGQGCRAGNRSVWLCANGLSEDSGWLSTL